MEGFGRIASELLCQVVGSVEALFVCFRQVEYRLAR